jgi:hypothetical protein
MYPFLSPKEDQRRRVITCRIMKKTPWPLPL